MFQSATSETKSAGSRVRRVPVERESELHPFHATNGHGFSGPAGAPPPSAPHPLAAMHRAVGNQAVLRSLSSLRPTIQGKLTINTPGDQYEREADRVAEQVMHMPDPSAVAAPALVSKSPVLQRKCACGGSGGASGQCSECAKKDELQRSAAGPASTHQAPQIVRDVLRQPGAPLDANTRAFFEPRFGHDFGHVRVHTDARAAASAKAVNAMAYTTAGSQIVFGTGAYEPATARGRDLIAHELTHVLQQGCHAGFALQRQANSPPDPGPDWQHVWSLSNDGKLCYDPGKGEPVCLSKDDLKKPELGPESTELCPQSWIKVEDGACCEGKRDHSKDVNSKDVNPLKCCPIRLLTSLGKCCKPGYRPDKSKTGCEREPLPIPQPPTHCDPGWSDPLGTGTCHLDPAHKPCPEGRFNVLDPGCSGVSPRSLMTPTVGAEILFKVGHPAEGEQDFDGALYHGDRTEFNRLLKSLKDSPAMRVQLVGGASIEGPGRSPEDKARLNRKLGGRRAWMVAAELMKDGISRDRIADPPTQDLRSECESLEVGIFNCGSGWAKTPPAQSDREVMARVFKSR